MDDNEASWFNRFEAWTIYHDLHIWYGVISVIAILTLGFIVQKEMTKTERMAEQIILLQKDLSASQLLVFDLRAENEKQRQIYLVPKADPAPVEKAASKVSETLNKVQDILIDKAVQPKIKTQTITNTVEVRSVVNKELNTMMKESYCATVPTAKECKK